MALINSESFGRKQKQEPKRLIVAVDEHGNRFKVTEEEAEKRGMTPLAKTSTRTAKAKPRGARKK